MALKLYEENDIQIIADTIRKKLGYKTENLLKFTSFSGKVGGVTVSGNGLDGMTLNGGASTVYNGNRTEFTIPIEVIPSDEYTYKVEVLSGSVTGTRFALNIRGGANIDSTNIQVNSGTSLELLNGSNERTFTMGTNVNYVTALQFIFSNDVNFNNYKLKISLINNTKENEKPKYKVNEMAENILKIGAKLPNEYQEVEYIETTGTQWINTNILIGSNIKTETKIEVTSETMDTPIIGTYQDSASNTLGRYYHLTPYSNKFYWGSNAEGNGGTYENVIGKQYKIIFNNILHNIIINDTILASNLTFDSLANGYLAISYRGGNTKRTGKFKYFYLRISDNQTDEILRDFIPCYRKSDNVCGFYDLINNEFYINNGTNEFLKGKDIY